MSFRQRWEALTLWRTCGGPGPTSGGSLLPVALLLLKLVLTPLFIGGPSLAARRWGPGLGGWIISLPLTSGPVALFLAFDRGSAFAGAAAEASLAGCVAISAYGVVYVRAAGRYGWPGALAAGLVGWLLAALAVQPTLHWPVPALFALVALVIVVAMRFMPAGGSAAAAATWTRRPRLRRGVDGMCPCAWPWPRRSSSA